MLGALLCNKLVYEMWSKSAHIQQASDSETHRTSRSTLRRMPNVRWYHSARSLPFSYTCRTRGRLQQWYIIPGKLRRQVQSLKPSEAKPCEVQVQNTDPTDTYYNQTAEQFVPIKNRSK